MLDRRNGQRQRVHARPGRLAPDAPTSTATPSARADAGSRRHHDAFADAIEPLESRLLMARFAIIGDLATTSATTLPLVAAMVKGWNPEQIITVGDNNNDDDTNFDATIGEYFHEYMDPYPGVHGAGSTTGNHLWPAMGNHDWDHPDGSLPYTTYFTLPQEPGDERYYQVRFGNVEFFMTDSDEREPDGTTPTSVQGQWLQGALAASTATWKIVIAHHPPYSSTTSPDAEWMRWPFQQWGADVVINGHHHVYERLNVGGFPYIINSAAGAALGEWDAIDSNSVVRYDTMGGALQMDAEINTLALRFFNRQGTQIDSITLTDNTIPVPGGPTNLIAGVVSSDRIDVSWTDNATTETGFILERAPGGTSTWAQIATPAANATSYVDTDPTLKSGLTYQYRVRADAAGTQSANSNVASATTLQPGYFNWIARGHMWKYLDTGVNQGTAWRPVAFDDSTWLGGRGQFGYGDNDETTIVSFGPNAAAKFPTTYFRKAFTVASPAQVTQLDLSMLRDDGAVVYLNGAEIWRSNMPATGTITFNTLASSPQGGTEETAWHGLSIDPALLVAGNNVIAVEVHQDNVGSTDLSFDMILTARLAAAIAPPSAFKATAVAHNQVNLTWVDTTVGEQGFKIARSLNGTTWAEIGTAAAGATTFTDNTTSGATPYWYRARSFNASGESRNSSVSTVTTPAAPNALPAEWTSGDVGAVAAAGSATQNSGVFTVNGSGADIAGTLDEFHFASRAWTGTGSIIARVNAITNPNSGAKFGVMFRESTAANSRHVMISITPANQIVVLARGASGNTSGPPAVNSVTTPVWLKLIRNADNTFTSQYSLNGTTWLGTSSSSAIPMASTILVGLCVTSKLDGTIATGTFDNVSVTTSTSTSSAATDSAVPPPPDDPGRDKWKKIKSSSSSSSLLEQVGLKDGPQDVLV